MAKIPLDDLKKDLEIRAILGGHALTFATTWGLFSPTEIDEGTKFLIDNVSVKPTDRILDIGCGYGPIGIALAKVADKGEVHMVDRDYIAIEYTKKNATANDTKNTKTYLSNGFSEVPKDAQFDLIISNLPAKVNKEFFWILFQEAFDHLAPGGSLVVVTVAHLERMIQKNFETLFGNYEKIGNLKTFTVARAVKV